MIMTVVSSCNKEENMTPVNENNVVNPSNKAGQSDCQCF